MPVAAGTYTYILAPYEWRKLNPSKPLSVMGWTHPAGAATALDLRPFGAMGIPEIAEGYGFFALQQGADIPAGALLLGNDIDGILSTQVKRDAEAMLDLAVGDLDWASVLDNLWGLLTQLADPTGSNAVKPLMPTVQGDLDLHLAGHSLVRRERFDKVKHPKALQQIRLNYQRMLKSVTPDMRGEVLQRLMRKTGLHAREIAVPSGGATIADDFTEASDTSLDVHTPTGANAFTGSWNENVGNWTVIASDDRAEVAGNSDPNLARADPSSGGLTSDDHYSQASVAAVFDFWAVGAAARIEAASDDCYIYRRSVENTDSHALKKYVSGVFSTVGTAVQSDFPDPANPWDAYLECDGSTITCKEAGVTKITETDTSLSGQTHAGLYAEGAHSNSGAEYGSWEAADLSAGSTVTLAGTSAGTSAVTGALSVDLALAGTAAGSSATAGALSVDLSLAGTSSGTSTATGTLTVTRGVSGSTAGTSSVTGALSVDIALSGAVAATSVATGDLSIQGENLAIAGTVAGTSSVTGALSVERSIAASVSSTSAVTGTLGVTRGIAGSVSGSSSVTGALVLTVGFQSTVAAVASVTGSMNLTLALLGSAAGLATVSGALTFQAAPFTPTPITGTGSNVGVTAGSGSSGVISGSGSV